MDYVLYVYGAAVFAFVWAAIYTLGGPTARLALTLGAYRYAPGYRPPALNRFVRGHADHRARRADFDALALLDFEPALETLALAAAVPPPSLIVRAELTEPGAEHWGDLLASMNTEEREIYNLEMYETHEAAKAVEREFLAGLDARIDAFLVQLDELLEVRTTVADQAHSELLERHGSADRWMTGQYSTI